MPLSVVQRLSLGELTPTTITLQMADRPMAQPEAVLEDVLAEREEWGQPGYSTSSGEGQRQQKQDPWQGCLKRRQRRRQEQARRRQ